MEDNDLDAVMELKNANDCLHPCKQMELSLTQMQKKKRKTGENSAIVLPFWMQNDWDLYAGYPVYFIYFCNCSVHSESIIRQLN